MSGGSYNYVHQDVQHLQKTLKEMENDSIRKDELPFEVAEKLYDMRSTLDPEFLKAVEYFIDGDYGLHSVEEEL